MSYPEWSHIPEHQTITMQDFFSTHFSRIAINAIRQLKIQFQSDKPPQLPDLNPIEDVWNLTKRCVNRCPVPPRIEEVLRQSLHKVWAEITRSDVLRDHVYA